MRTYANESGIPLKGAKRLMVHKSKRHRGDSDEIETQTAGNKRNRSWSKHDLASGIRPKTSRQAEAFESFFVGNNLGLLGSAGTGKTFLAAYFGLTSMLEGWASRVIITRSAVQSRNIGHLPGTEEEKLQQYEIPYRPIFAELLPKYPNAYDDMKRDGLVEFVSTSFLRGLTIRDAVIIVEEAQNMDFDEIDTIMTRVGEGSRVILTGDTKRQNDLARQRGQHSGLPYAARVLKGIPGFDLIEFNKEDCVRSGFARAWLHAVEDAEEQAAA